MLKKNLLKLATCTALAASATLPATAEESSALVDALVRKGVLTTKEADEIRADMAREAETKPATSADKIKLNSSVSELKLYGDLRLRYQYDDRDVQANPDGVGVNDDLEQRGPSGSQRSRWRFRLRLNADFKLTEDFFGGVELQTAIASDSGNATYENGFSDYPIFISKAYLGWSPNEWLTVTADKIPNPFYTTDLIWDSDINPNGIAERVALHEIFPTLGGGGSVEGYSKDGKQVAAAPAEERPWELTLIAGQFLFDDNFEGGANDLDDPTRDNDRTTDAYLFQTQLVGSYKFRKDLKLTIAPGWMVYNAGSATGLDNENEFEDTSLVSGATRNLNILLLPGDLAFKVGGIKTKFYWDVAYNLEGRKRANDIYRLAYAGNPDEDPDDLVKGHNNRDNLAWLAGVQLGENKKRGDWSLLANYRETGIAAVDPNLNDSDFALGELNTRGLKLGIAYNLTDFAVFGITYMHAWNLRGDLMGGEATEGNEIADGNTIRVFQVDLNLKF
ncbi:MAG: putative porin [Chthoniobacteraceae bacterium]